MDLRRWQKFTIFQQLGNIASELSRVRHWRAKSDLKSCNASLERVLELIDLTISDKKNISRVGEIGRLREIIADLYGQTGYYKVNLGELEKLLFDFAIRA